MAPNKFEENIKNKLENRTIQPSKEAWNTLQDRLDASTNNEKPRPIFWIGLAASIVGILFVVSQFFNDSQINQSTPEIVVNPEVINSLSLFQYMIGNADYSVTGQHNLKILALEEYGPTGFIPVPGSHFSRIRGKVLSLVPIVIGIKF